MRNNKKFSLILIVVMISSLLLVGSAAAKPADKVDVCHRTGNGTFILINISRNALPDHLNHGDGLPNEALANQPGKHFNADCSVTETLEKELVQTLTVYPTGETFTSKALLNGQKYEIKVSGTYTYNGVPGDWADAEYFLKNGVVIKGDTEYPSTPNILDVSINSCTTNTDWGSSQSLHVYTKEWTGTGATLTFCIYDSVYWDNNGSLTIEIWKIN
jgi:hypothetical protein